MRRLVAFLPLAAVIMLACEPGTPETSASAVPLASASPSAEPWSGYPIGWTEFPPPPERPSGDAWVWAGSELLVAGGCDPDLVEDRCRETRRVFAFDPVVGSWRVVSSSIAPMADADAVWTGEEAIFLETYREHGPIIGQAYDPSSKDWRRIPRAPIDGAYGVVLVWTGEDLIAWGGGDRGDERTSQGAAYDPTSDTWRRIADAPIGLNLASGVWTGHEMIVFGSLLSGANRAPTPTSVGAAYDPATDTWRELPPSALSPQATSAVLVGDQLVAWDYEVHSQEYNPAKDRWSAPLRMPLGFSECYPDSVVVAGLLFAWFCGKAALYDAATSAWQRIEGGPLDETIYSKAYKSEIHVWRFADLVPAGSVVVMPTEGITLDDKGVACYGCAGSPTSYWVYRPPEMAPTRT
jgi:Kelch motif